MRKRTLKPDPKIERKLYNPKENADDFTRVPDKHMMLVTHSHFENRKPELDIVDGKVVVKREGVTRHMRHQFRPGLAHIDTNGTMYSTINAGGTLIRIGNKRRTYKRGKLVTD